jgi:hypothetical protein
MECTFSKKRKNNWKHNPERVSNLSIYPLVKMRPDRGGPRDWQKNGLKPSIRK